MPTPSLARARPLLLALALIAPACPLPPEFVGETLGGASAGGASTGDTGPTSDAGATTGPQDSTTTGGDAPDASATTGGPVEGAYGSFCEVGGAGPDIQRTVLLPHPVCDSGICLLVSDAPPLACSQDPECADENPTSTCGPNGLCNLTPAFIAANARCTVTCELDEDCPAVPGCAAGLRCSTITLLPPFCCQKVCACRDHLDIAQAESAEAICANDPDLCMGPAAPNP